MPRLAAVPELDDELDRLYALSPEEFTAARNDLAKRLRAAGQKDEAERVKALRKPPVSAWAVNRLARNRGEDVRRLASAGERLVAAQTGTLAGGGPAAFASSRAEHADAVRSLTAAAVEALEGQGRQASPQTVERIARTLRAASLDEAARPALVAGQLTDDVEATGFTLLEGLELPDPPSAGAQPSRVDTRALRARLREARAAARELDRQAVRGREAAERARADADAAEREAAGLEAEADRARDAVGDLERELENA